MEVRITVPEPNETTLPDQGVSADKGPDAPLQDLDDPPVGKSAAPATLQPDPDTILGPGAGERMPGDADRRVFRGIGNNDRPPFPGEAESSFPDRPPNPAFPRPDGRPVWRSGAADPFLSGPSPEFPFPLAAEPFSHAFQRGTEQSPLPLGNARNPVPVMDVGDVPPDGVGIPAKPVLPVRLVPQRSLRGASLIPHPTFCGNT